MNRSKDDADAVGLEGLRRVCEAVSIPVVSIGGVTAENAGETMREGAEWSEDAFRGGLCVRRSDGWCVCLIH